MHRSWPFVAALAFLAVLACSPAAAPAGEAPAESGGSGTASAEREASPTAGPALTQEAPAGRAVSTPTAGFGTVEVRVTDAPPRGVTKILIRARNVQVHRADAPEDGGWQTLIEGEVSFDLVEVTGLEAILGSNTVPAGEYTQVRMEIESVLVTVEGQEREATLPSGTLKVVRPFTVEDGGVTVLTFDFEADKSVVLAGQRVQFKPVVKLLVVKGPKPQPERTPAGRKAEVAAPSGGPRTIKVTEGGFFIEPRSLALAPGETVVFEITSEDFTHTFTVDELGLNVQVPAGQKVQQTFAVPATPGQYALYCAVPGHRSQGMQATFIVGEPGESKAAPKEKPERTPSAGNPSSPY